MNSAEIKEALDDFLKHSQKRVLIVKGIWGVGKTYFWKDYIKKNRDSIEEDVVSYVSLFGAKSIADVERQILHGSDCVKQHNWEKTTPLAKHFLKVLQCIKQHNWKKTTQIAKYFPILSQYVAGYERFLIKKFLICFDDFERRKHEELSMEEILGFISFLKDERACRIVIIFDDTKLEEMEEDALKIYREKIVDIEVTYDPKIADNVALILKKESRLDFYTELFQRLGVNNLRVMKQCSWNIKYFERLLDDVENSLREQILSHIVIITSFYQMKKKFNVEIETLSDTSSYAKGFNMPITEDMKDKRKVMYDFIGWDYHYADYDKQIIQYIKHGGCNLAEFQRQVDELKERERQNKIVAELKDIWALYGYSFASSEQELIKKFTEFMNRYAHLLSYQEFSLVCKTLTSMESTHSLSEWKKNFIKAHADTANVATLKKWLEEQKKDPELVSLLSKRIKELTEKATISSVLFYMTDDKDWGDKDWGSETDIAFLDSQTVDDFYNWMKEEKNPDLLPYIGSFLNTFGSLPKTQSIVNKLKKALKKVGHENRLNKIRVENILKVDIDKEDT